MKANEFPYSLCVCVCSVCYKTVEQLLFVMRTMRSYKHNINSKLSCSCAMF